MHRPDEPRFIFHGSAYALGGEITRPFADVLEVQAPVSLPSVGGYGSAHVDGYRYRELVSFRRASAQVAGNTRGGVHDTVITVTIEDLNIMDMVTADKVVGRMTSSHPGTHAADAASLLPLGSYFVNLRIAGVPVDPRPHQVLMRRGKLADLEREYAMESSPFCDAQGSRFSFPERRGAAAAAASHVEAQGGTRAPRRYEETRLTTSIFQELEVRNAPFDVVSGCALHVEGFGRIILGEYVITRDARRLTMIQCHLGCAMEGTLGTGGVEGNGSPP